MGDIIQVDLVPGEIRKSLIPEHFHKLRVRNLMMATVTARNHSDDFLIFFFLSMIQRGSTGPAKQK